MSEKEALSLLDYVLLFKKADTVSLVTIGNGEHVVVLNGPYYIWDVSSFQKYQQEQENMVREKQQRRRKQDPSRQAVFV